MRIKYIARMILLLACGFFIVSSVLSADLTAMAVHGFWPSRSAGDPMGLLYANLLMKNESSHTIRVPTQYLDSYLLTKEDRGVLHLVVKPQRFDDGVYPVTPEADLRIVELRPGEVAWISWKQNSEPLPEKPLYVRFEVDRGLATRYGLWSGEIEVQSTRDVERQRVKKEKVR